MSTSVLLFPWLKEATSLFKFIELSNKGVQAEKHFSAAYKNEQQFDRFFNALEFAFDEKELYSAFQFDAADVQLAVRLPYALAFRYVMDEEFNSIRMQADHRNRYGALSMDEYFITPSYIPEEDLRKRESLMQAEKESSNTKIERMKAKFFQNFLPHEYISGSLFEGINRVVITGNPGVGKSTYARWLCYKWAKQELNIKGILLYVNLRQLTFGKDNSLVQYIATHYLKGADNMRLQKILSTINQDFYFVLDGFDELDDAGQKTLKNDLYQLGSHAKFILLSRPYGLLNNQGLHWDFSFQIDGFNNSNIYNYVDKFLSLNGRKHMRDQLLDIISQNRVLEDYAHNPLMLSYITYLFLEEEEGAPQTQLLQVQSQYQLQDIVFGWIRQHELKKKTKASLDQLLHAAEEFAYQMEVSKKPIVASKETIDHAEEIARYLNHIGLGKMQRLQQQQWQFSFNTITFQEFLAARYLSPCIDVEAFLYLCKEKYFWNFTKMVIGCLSTQGNDELIKNILETHVQIMNKNQRAPNLFFYLMHLSEASSDFLKNYLSEEDVLNLYAAYQLAVWDETWRLIITDAFARIYSKLEMPRKIQVQNILFSELEKLLPSSPDAKTYNVEHAKILILKLRLYDNPVFLSRVIELQNRTLVLLEQSTDGGYITLIHEGLMFVFDEVLGAVKKEKLMALRPALQQMLETADDTFIFPKARLQLHFTQAESLSQSVHEACRTLKGLLRRFEQGETDVSKPLSQHIQQLATGIYQLGHLQKEASSEAKEKLLPFFQKSTGLILRAMGLLSMDDYDEDELGQLIIEGLATFNAPALYDWILEAALVIQPAYMIVRIPDNDAFFSYLESLLQANEEALDELAMDKLIMSLNIIENARNQFARIRKQFADVLLAYVMEHHRAFEQSAGGYVQAAAGTAEAEQYEITRKFNAVLQSALMDSEVFAYDKKYLIDQFTAFHHYRYFRSYFHPMIWGQGFNLYQQDYWKLVLEYTHDVADFPALMSVLRNPNIYRYMANLIPLQQLLQYFLSCDRDAVPDNFPLRLVEMLSRCLVLIKSAEGNPILKDKDEYLQYIIALVDKYGLKEEFPNIDLYQLEGQDLLLFILLYHYTKEEQYHLIEDYDDWLDNYPRERKALLDTLLAVFTKNEQLDLKALEALYPVMGKKLARRLEELLLFRTELIEQFDKDTFEELLPC
jgi:hypothetical protein